MNRRNCQIDHGSVAGGRAESHVARSSIAPFALDDTITGFGEGEPEPRPEYTVVDFMSTLTSETLSVSFFIDNIFDETQVYGQEFATSPVSTNATSFFAAHTGQPRTIGVRVRKRFE